MKLLIKHGDLEKAFDRLLDGYGEYHFATAWAGIGSKPYTKLLKHWARIKRLVVGIHFYQTHPDFIQSLHQHEGVRFMEQPNGTFHPKLYLFQNSPEDWALLVGSANFTQAAFAKNTEATLLVNSKESGSAHLREEVLILIEREWKNSKVFSQQDLDNYRLTWKRLGPKRKSLEGDYAGRTGSLPHRTPLLNMDWDTYMRKLRTKRGGQLATRVQLMQHAQRKFREKGVFTNIDGADQQRIAGVIGIDGGVDWNLFGNMSPFGKFKRWVRNTPELFSDALDEIPLDGAVSKVHFEAYKNAFKKATGLKNPIALATRLLAMKRPDTFICLASKNKEELAKAFQVPISHLNMDNYWDVVVAPIQDSEWWQNPTPRNPLERAIEGARAAFLDVLYYQP